MRRGAWALAPVEGWPDNRSCDRLAAWTWATSGFADLVVVNLSDERADGRVRIGDVPDGPIVLTDLLSGDIYRRDGGAIRADGLYVALAGRGVHLLHWAAGTETEPEPRSTHGAEVVRPFESR
jgi:hypothetical protein